MNNRGDMAIDDIQITEGLCSQEELSVVYNKNFR